MKPGASAPGFSVFWHHDVVAVSLVSPVLVGRQGEVQTLSHALDRLLAGEQATIVVGGEAGVGKSRLVHELVGEARQAGARVLVGSCIELDGGGIPFAPVVEMMRDLAASCPPASSTPHLARPAPRSAGSFPSSTRARRQSRRMIATRHDCSS